MGLSGEVREEDEAGREGPVVHGFLKGPKGGAYKDLGVAEPMLLSLQGIVCTMRCVCKLNDLRHPRGLEHCT